MFEIRIHIFLYVIFGLILVIKLPTVQADVEPRIINGTVAKHDYTKHQVSIRIKSKDYPFGNGHICGGSLIGNNKVLTAAHCVYNTIKSEFRDAREFIVVMGTLNRFEKPNGTIISEVKYIAHLKTFESKTMKDDIALLFLKNGLPKNKTHLTVEPIALNNLTLPVGSICQVSGWGKTRSSNKTLPANLRVANVSIVASNICSMSYTGAIKPGMFCAGYMKGGTDACQGDSGGPLVHNGTLVGIVSWGSGCGVSSFPGVYTDVKYYNEWIVKTNGSRKLGKSIIMFIGLMIILCLDKFL